MRDAGLRKNLRHRTYRSDTLGLEFSSWYLSARWGRGITGRSSGRLRRPLSLFVERLLSLAATGCPWPTAAAAAKNASRVQIHGVERNGSSQSVKEIHRLSLSKL